MWQLWSFEEGWRHLLSRESEEAARYDWWSVCLDETHLWDVDPEDKRWLKELCGIYFYDRNDPVDVPGCDEPMYHLRWVEAGLKFRDGVPPGVGNDLYEDYVVDALGVDAYVPVAFVEGLVPSRRCRFGPCDDENEVRRWLEENGF